MSYLAIGIKSYFACAYSAWTYIWGGMPSDKQSYWANEIGFADKSAPEYKESIETYEADPSFHHCKDVMVEWCDAWPQRAAKVSALFGCLLAVLSAIAGVIVGVLFGALAF